MVTSVSMAEVQGCLVVAMPDEMGTEAFNAIYQTVAQRLSDKRLPGTVLDFSGVQLLDLHEFAQMQELARVITFLGARVVFVALNAGIACFLAQTDASIDGLQFCQNTEDALALLATAGPR
jgi:anti-anti-sigma regulatory factor